MLRHFANKLQPIPNRLQLISDKLRPIPHTLQEILRIS